MWGHTFGGARQPSQGGHKCGALWGGPPDAVPEFQAALQHGEGRAQLVAYVTGKIAFPPHIAAQGRLARGHGPGPARPPRHAAPCRHGGRLVAPSCSKASGAGLHGGGKFAQGRGEATAQHRGQRHGQAQTRQRAEQQRAGELLIECRKHAHLAAEGVMTLSRRATSTKSRLFSRCRPRARRLPYQKTPVHDGGQISFSPPRSRGAAFRLHEGVHDRPGGPAAQRPENQRAPARPSAAPMRARRVLARPESDRHGFVPLLSSASGTDAAHMGQGGQGGGKKVCPDCAAAFGRRIAQRRFFNPWRRTRAGAAPPGCGSRLGPMFGKPLQSGAHTRVVSEPRAGPPDAVPEFPGRPAAR